MPRSNVSDDLREREDDILWRVRGPDGWWYIYLLVEFQSTVARYMAVRIMTYESLLYEGLIRSKQLLLGGSLQSPPLCCIMAVRGVARGT